MKHSQPLLSTPALARPVEALAHPLSRLVSAGVVTTLILLIALAQGAIYLALAPPWQHYDEPTHFEYAWLIAQRDRLPAYGDQDATMRREVAASMAEHGFFRDLANINSLKTDRTTWIGISELQHPPAYYMLVSLPLRLAVHLDIESQLYVARSVSLLLFLATIVCAIGLMRELLPPEHPLCWAVPLAIALLPPFVDLMTSVNNDVGVTAVFSLFLWGAVRLLRNKLNWRSVLWVFGSAGLAAAIKNTGAVALALAVLACLIAFWRQRGWRWRWLLAINATLVAIGLVSTIGWGDAASWYREADVVSQVPATRVSASLAPVGTHALMLETRADGRPSKLINPLLFGDAGRLAGHTITVGGWVWADRPVAVDAPALSYKRLGMRLAEPATRMVNATTTPVFAAWTFQVPEDTYYLSYMVLASPQPAGGPPAQIFLSGALIVDGVYPVDQLPVFDDPAASSGVWGGRRFSNLVRNPAFEASWPRARPWVDRALITYIHRTPAQLVTTLIDVPRIMPVFLQAMLRPPVDGLIKSFSWGQVQLANPLWLYLLYAVGLLSICGCLRWLVAARAEPGGWLRPAIIFLMLVGLAVWGNTLLRPLPLLDEQYVTPSVRYTYPAIIVTLLACIGGWWAVWPRKQRSYALAALLLGLLILNIVSMQAIWSFY